MIILRITAEKEWYLMEWILALPPLWATLFCTFFTWGVTAAGAALVFAVKWYEGQWMKFLVGFGLGVMIAASFWSLLAPAIEQSGSWITPALGFAAGGAFILLAERCLEKCQLTANVTTRWNLLMILAVTLHNIPEGMAIGVAFGAEGGLAPWLLAVGIGLQNFPEGAAVAFPLRKEGYSRRKSFFYGQASGFVEPAAGLFGVLAAQTLGNLLPLLLSFAAGSMMAVVGGELMPEEDNNERQLSVAGLLLGFLVMMILDVALG